MAHRDLSLENILLTEASGAAERFEGAENVFIQMDGLRIYVVHMFVCVWRCMEYGSTKKMVSHGSHGFTCFFFETDPTLGPKIGRRLDRSQVRNK